MNIGQILEMHLGLIGKHFGTEFENPIFDGAREPELYEGCAAWPISSRPQRCSTTFRLK
jgi:DNA-directed RNA polymerase beta subunit